MIFLSIYTLNYTCLTEDNLTYNNDGYDDLKKLCKFVKQLTKQGFDHDPETLPFETALSRFVQGHYILINVVADTRSLAKEKLTKEITNGQLVYLLHKTHETKHELIGIVHVTKYL